VQNQRKVPDGLGVILWVGMPTFSRGRMVKLTPAAMESWSRLSGEAI
jgi:hypothetical protein